MKLSLRNQLLAIYLLEPNNIIVLVLVKHNLELNNISTIYYYILYLQNTTKEHESFKTHNVQK